jgi:hypothetical protein
MMSGTEPPGKNAHGKSAARPVALQGDLANLPEALKPLKEIRNWVCWKWKRRADKNGGGEWTKPPFRPQAPAQYAKINDPATWGSYEEALAAYQAGQCDGIGFAFLGSKIAAFDLDKCRNPETGEIAPEALSIVERCASYTEITPSGTGLRVIGTSIGGEVQRKQKVPGAAVEVESYRNTARYITISGNPLTDTQPQLADVDALIDAVVAELDGVAKPNWRSDFVGETDWRNRDFRSDLDKWIEVYGDRYAGPDDYKPNDTYLPLQLKKLIANVPPAEDLSAAFHHVVCWLHYDLKWSAAKIEAYIDGKPVVPDRYNGRLEQEIYRCLCNAEKNKTKQSAKAGQSTKADGPTISAQALGAMQFEPIKYVVPGIIVEGLTLLAGKPKIGKSWLLLHAAIAVARGGVTLGEIQCAEGDVLYCALEDNMHRLQSRMAMLLGGAEGWPARLFFRCEMPRLAEGGLEQLRDWIKAANHPRLVIIDTLAMVRAPKGRDESSYDADYGAVKELRDMANEHNVAVVIVHHLRKAAADDAFDTVSGTLGLTGAPDSILVIKYEYAGVVLYGRGRDLIELEKALSFNKDACKWTIKGDATEVRRSTERGVILAALDGAAEALGPRQIAEVSGMKAANVRFLLNKLLNDGEIVKASYGKYRRREAPAGPR